MEIVDLRSSSLIYQIKNTSHTSGKGMEDGRSEDIVGQKWDRCVADTIIKTGKEAIQIVNLFYFNT